MVNDLKELTIITITYNNFDELLKTCETIQPLTKKGCIHLIINGGKSVKAIMPKNCNLFEEEDKGIYDALNKGIDRVKTKYFMLIHSGDKFIGNINYMIEALKWMENNNLDLFLNDCYIEYKFFKRKIKCRNWFPWMFKVGAQPAHPPIIYNSRISKTHKYNINYPIIADFKYLNELFECRKSFMKGEEFLISMSSGGATSSGLQSFFMVNKEYYHMFGLKKTIIFIIFRPWIKLLQMI